MDKLTCLIKNNNQKYVQEIDNSKGLTFGKVLNEMVRNEHSSDLAKLMKEVNHKSIIMDVKPVDYDSSVDLNEPIEPYVIVKKEQDAIYYILNLNVDIFSVIG